MGDAGEDWLHAEELNLTPLEDDCKLLGSVLDDTLKSEVGARIYAKLAKIRGQAHAASLLERNGDSVGAGQVQERMRQELMAMPLEEALPIVHRLRRNRTDARKSSKSCDEAFGRLIAEGISPDKLYEAVTTQVVEVVLTAHPTQVNRRTLQYKHTRIAALLQQNDRPDLVKEERDNLLEDIAREVTALWQTDELRRQKPSPVDEARGGLNIVEQSLWNAVPAFMRKQSAALKRHTGRDLPLNATPFRFASWMGGDRDGNPNVTAKVTSHVVCLARWMAADMYLREVDALRFELSILVRTNNRRVALKQSTQGAHLPEGMVIGVRPDTYRESAAGLDGMPAVPGVLPGQDLEGGSECDFDLEDDEEGEGSQMDPLDTLTSDGPSGSTTPLHGMSKPNSQINIPAAALLGAGIPSASASVAAITERIKEKEMLMSEASDEVGALRSNGLNGANGFGATMGAAAPGGLFAPGGTSTSASGGMGGRGLFLSPAMSVSAAQLDRAASQGVTDPSPLRRSLRSQRAAADNIAFRRMHEHPGFHPYRVILGDVRQKLINTRKRMEELLSQVEPSDTDEYYADTEELEKPLRAIYWSLYECGGGMVADGRLLDLVRRVATFGLCLMKLDIRQESTRHSEALDAVTTYLGYGSYLEWDEDKRIEWLINELQGRRPLIPPGMPMSAEVREVLDTARVVAQLGPGSLGAYVISMTKAASDVLAVELLQREAIVQVSPEERWESNPGRRTLRVVPLFETLEDLDAGGPIMRRLLALPWYRQHVRHAHGNHQEVMLGYSDSGKDAGRLAANWALYRCQEELVAVMREAEVTLTLFHGRGGTVGRGGGPTYLAIQSQPPGSVEGSFRITEQGEMVQAKFGISAVAQYQLEIYTTAVLLASVKPPSPPKHQCWRDVMTRLGEVSCEAYRAVVYKDPAFITYFKHATPEAELGNLNIGSRPARRRADNAGINTLRAIPWQFAWTQTRLILPSWLGIGDALFKAIEEGHLPELQAMYREWPFFAATIDLIEMILAKSDARIAALYEDVLVSDPEELQLGQRLRVKLLETCRAVLLVSGHKMLLEHNPTLRKLIQMRNPYIDPINIMQVEVLRRLRQDPNNIKLRDALLVSINGIAAGMRNTG
ncbi:phosphoenolpyruvate carboxylase-domain-containing protein [Haematococcus lacustris]